MDHVTSVKTPDSTVPSTSVGSVTVTTDSGAGQVAGASGVDTSSDPDPGYSLVEPGFVPAASVVLSVRRTRGARSPAGMKAIAVAVSVP